MTLDEASAAFAFQDIYLYFVDGLADILSSITAKIIYNEGIMGYHGIPQMPIFAYKAIADMQSPIGDTDKLVSEFCGVGANILYQRNTIGGHVAEFFNGHPAAESWLDSVLNGTYAQNYPTQGCTIQTVTVNISSTPT
jgi:hypothetical protein